MSRPGSPPGPAPARGLAGTRLAALLLAFLTLGPWRARAAEELRGLWVDAFHPALRSEAELQQLVESARAAGFNSLYVQVRKRGDAYYDSRLEPRASDVAPGFDPLRRLLELAHDPAPGPRLEVHAWVVAFNIWNQRDTPPPQADHPYRKHPDWLTRSAGGATWDGSNYAFDPGHPEVQRHTFEVAMDLIRRYDLDGFHWDYIRYAGRDWGYHDASVQRFNRRHGRTGKPASTDPDWLQFRRDQVTALVRKVTLHALAEKPALRISAATITFAPGITSTAQWPSSAAYSDVLQDWRAWMEEGLLDFNLPMAYFRQTEHAGALAAWNTFIKDHQYRRRAALGLGFYLNSVSNTLDQIRLARRPSARGQSAAGVLAYSYAAPALDASRETAFAALSQPSAQNPDPPFAEPALPPSAPWKTDPSRGHLMGWVLRSADQSGVDGAEITVCGASERTLFTDATGFFGAVDLPAGEYNVRVSAPGFASLTADATVPGGRVAQLDFDLVPPDPADPAEVRAGAGARTAVFSWSFPEPAPARLELRPARGCDPARVVDVRRPARRHSVLVTGLEPGSAYVYGVTRLADPANPASRPQASADLPLRTAGTMVVDNPQARFTGGWSVITAGADRQGLDYRQAASVAGNATPSIATWETSLPTPGEYAVECWVPPGANRSRLAPYALTGSGNTPVKVVLDQAARSAQWTPLAERLAFEPGRPAGVQLDNRTGESGRTLAADAVRWRYREEQDLPAPDRLPLWWARHFFPEAAPVPGTSDHDLDGMTDAAEYLAGTDPTDPGSALAILAFQATTGGWRLHFSPYLPARGYLLESRRLGSGLPWDRVDSRAIAGDSGDGVFPSPEGGLAPGAAGDSRVYRVACGWTLP